MSNQPSVVICDAGPIIHLDELGQLALLEDFAAVYVPTQVWNEVTTHRPSALIVAAKQFKKIDVSITPESLFTSVAPSFSLDLGEQAALVLMKEYPEAIFLTDDAAARLAAITLGYQVHGSIGILLRAIRRNQLTKDAVMRLLKELPSRSTLYVRKGLLDEIIVQLERSE